MMEDWMLSQPSSTQTVWEWAGFGSTVRPWVRIYMVGQNAVLCWPAELNQWTYLVAYHMIYTCNNYGKRLMDTLKKSHRYPQKRSQQILQGILCSKGKYDIIIITILPSCPEQNVLLLTGISLEELLITWELILWELIFQELILWELILWELFPWYWIIETLLCFRISIGSEPSLGNKIQLRPWYRYYTHWYVMTH